MLSSSYKHFFLSSVGTIIASILKHINRYIPKDPRLILFISRPDYSDSPRSLFEWLNRTGRGRLLRISWLYESRPASCSELPSGVPLRSFLGLWTFLRAYIVITSHNQLLSIASRRSQLYVALGHGIYLKSMGYMKRRSLLPSALRKRELTALERVRRNVGFMAASSNTSRTALAACYHLEADRIAVTGLPRMDELFRPERSLIVETFFPGLKPAAFFLCMPTHREPETGYRPEGLSCVDRFDSEGLYLLDAELGKVNGCMLIKLHPNEPSRRALESEAANTRRIAVTSGDPMPEIPMYRIIGSADCLITDYSSVYFEYLVLDRPIVFVLSDYDQYVRSRGLLFTPFEHWAPGPCVSSIAALGEQIRLFSNENDLWEPSRRRVREQLIDFPDDRSSERVWTEIQKRAPHMPA